MESITNLHIFVYSILYVASYVYSLRWFIKRNFLDDLRGDTTLGSMIAYMVWSLFGPVGCLLIFFNWFIGHDMWMINVKDIKYWHILNFVPFIGWLSVLYFGVKGQGKYDRDSRFNYLQYVWGGSDKTIYTYIIWQILSSGIIGYFLLR